MRFSDYQRFSMSFDCAGSGSVHHDLTCAIICATQYTHVPTVQSHSFGSLQPTTGLDSRSAAVVMRVLRKVAQTGRAIICTIHQVSVLPPMNHVCARTAF